MEGGSKPQSAWGVGAVCHELVTLNGLAGRWNEEIQKDWRFCHNMVVLETSDRRRAILLISHLQGHSDAPTKTPI